MCSSTLSTPVLQKPPARPYSTSFRGLPPERRWELGGATRSQLLVDTLREQRQSSICGCTGAVAGGRGNLFYRRLWDSAHPRREIPCRGGGTIPDPPATLIRQFPGSSGWRE